MSLLYLRKRIVIMSSSSDSYLANIRATTCANCKLSLVCFMGREYTETELYWCQRCQGWWFPELDLLLRCTAFIVGPKGTIVIDGRRSRTRDVTVHGMRTLVEDCPNCNPQGENPIEVFDGYNETEET